MVPARNDKRVEMRRRVRNFLFAVRGPKTAVPHAGGVSSSNQLSRGADG